MLVVMVSTHQLGRHPLGALRQEFEIWVGVNREDIDKLGLQQRANVHPLFVNLLDSKKKKRMRTCLAHSRKSNIG